MRKKDAYAIDEQRRGGGGGERKRGGTARQSKILVFSRHKCVMTACNRRIRSNTHVIPRHNNSSSRAKSQQQRPTTKPKHQSNKQPTTNKDKGNYLQKMKVSTKVTLACFSSGVVSAVAFVPASSSSASSALNFFKVSACSSLYGA